jgi:hypothetical protein
VTTNNVNFRVQCWEDDDRLDFTVTVQAARMLFWDPDRQFTWSCWWEWNGGNNKNQFHFTFGVNLPSGW